MWVRVGESGKMKHAYTTWANKPFIFFSCFLFGACSSVRLSCSACIIKSVHHTVFPRACVRGCLCVHARTCVRKQHSVATRYDEWISSAAETSATDTVEHNSRGNVFMKLTCEFSFKI